MVAVNIMGGDTVYEKYVRAAVKAGVDLIISGAGFRPASKACPQHKDKNCS